MFPEGPEATHPQNICHARGSLSGGTLPFWGGSPHAESLLTAAPQLQLAQDQVWSQLSWMSGVEARQL